MNKKILFTIPILLPLLASCVGTKCYDESEYECGVQWGYGRDEFRILQLCDIHLSQSDIIERHFKLINKTIEDADADLIVLNGDSFTYADKGIVTKLFSFIDSYDIPWTFTFGNHDDQGYYSDTYIQELLGSRNLFKNVKFVNLADDNVTGRSNFVINIYDREKGADGLFHNTDIFQVYCFESHSYNFGTMGYDFIKQDQIDWYERMVNHEKNKKGYLVPSIMYFHIPLPEFFTAWNEVKGIVPNEHSSYIPEGFDPKASTDEFGGGPLPSSDTHLFDKAHELGSTVAISCAHDHINDSVIVYDGIALCFGVHSTDRIYYDKEKLGGQVISINRYNPWNPTFENIKNSYEEVEGK